MSGPKIFDRTKETSTTSGTGQLTLAGAQTGYRAFADVLSDGDTCLYAVIDGSDWEIGVGTFVSSGTKLTRTTVLASSNGGAAVNFSGSSKDVWIDLAADFPDFLNPTTDYASIVAFKAGRIGFPTDGFSIVRDSGSALAPWGPIYPLTPPIDGDFAWINQSSSSTTAASGGIVLSVPANATAPNFVIRKKAAPATPYTITAAIIPGWIAPSNGFALCFRESGSGKLATLLIQLEATGTNIYSYKLNSPTVGSAIYTNLTLYGNPPPLFVRIADDGVNRTCSLSWNGQTWLEFHSVGRTDFLTADEVGFVAFSQNGTWPMHITLLSWKEA